MKLTVLVLMLALPWLANAEDKDLEHGFVINAEVQVPVSRQQAFDAFMAIGDWWNPAHSYSGDAKNMRIEDDCFCEIWDQGKVRHLELVAVQQPELIRFHGGLGPLQTVAAAGTMNITFTETENGSKINLNYAVFGYADGGLSAWRQPVGGVLREQLDRLAAQLKAADH